MPMSPNSYGVGLSLWLTKEKSQVGCSSRSVLGMDCMFGFLNGCSCSGALIWFRAACAYIVCLLSCIGSPYLIR